MACHRRRTVATPMKLLLIYVQSSTTPKIRGRSYRYVLRMESEEYRARARTQPFVQQRSMNKSNQLRFQWNPLNVLCFYFPFIAFALMVEVDIIVTIASRTLRASEQVCVFVCVAQRPLLTHQTSLLHRTTDPSRCCRLQH